MTPDPFTFQGGSVKPGTISELRYTVSETYLGDPIRIPVSIIHGTKEGPTAFLTGGIHGDELNGIETVRRYIDNHAHTGIHGTIICLPVLNVPGFLAQERYLPILDRDLNRSFPGSPNSTSSHRIAHNIYETFIKKCDFGIDFHTSTRGRTNMFHTRADLSKPAVKQLAESFPTNLIISTDGAEGSLREEATRRGTPTITIEMGQAHRIENDFIDKAIAGIKSTLGAYNILPNESLVEPNWQVIGSDAGDRTWVRADAGGVVDVNYNVGDHIEQGEALCKITNPFRDTNSIVTAPFDSVIAGLLKNPVVYPGNPICQLVQTTTNTDEQLESGDD